jgi:hypothetical protein
VERVPDGITVADVRADFQANLIPGTTLISAMVGEVTRAQQHGFSPVFVPFFLP